MSVRRIWLAAAPRGRSERFATPRRPIAAAVRCRFRVETSAAGKVCFALPHARVSQGVAHDDASRYVVVSIANGAAKYPLLVHLYDLGAERGFRVVGLERPEASEVDGSDWGLEE